MQQNTGIKLFNQTFKIQSFAIGPVYSRHCGREGRRRFYVNIDHMICVNSHPDHVVVSLDKKLYDDYFCLVALYKQQVQWTRIQRKFQKHCIIENS